MKIQNGHRTLTDCCRWRGDGMKWLEQQHSTLQHLDTCRNNTNIPYISLVTSFLVDIITLCGFSNTDQNLECCPTVKPTIQLPIPKPEEHVWPTRCILITSEELISQQQHFTFSKETPVCVLMQMTLDVFSISHTVIIAQCDVQLTPLCSNVGFIF